MIEERLIGRNSIIKVVQRACPAADSILRVEPGIVTLSSSSAYFSDDTHGEGPVELHGELRPAEELPPSPPNQRWNYSTDFARLTSSQFVILLASNTFDTDDSDAWFLRYDRSRTAL